jgi:chemotaxis methyl-accepting protein methylase
LPFEEFLRVACPLLGLNWVRFKNRRTRRILARRLGELGFRLWDNYAALLARDLQERAHLRKALTVTISRFRRNNAVFHYLEQVAFPTLLHELDPDETLVVWSAGTASGQEAFSVAAAYCGVSQTEAARHELRIVATDLNRTALRRGLEDRWTPSELRELTDDARQRLFVAGTNGPVVRQDLRRSVLFVQSDLVAAPPILFAHVILCRNTIMTYFERDARKQAMRYVVDVLRPGGYLILGRKEKLPNAWADAFGMHHLGRKIYRLAAVSH